VIGKNDIRHDNEIFLLEVWYDEKPEIVVPNRIQKIKEFAAKLIDICAIDYF
jgi:hypothetical protein